MVTNFIYFYSSHKYSYDVLFILIRRNSPFLTDALTNSIYNFFRGYSLLQSLQKTDKKS